MIKHSFLSQIISCLVQTKFVLDFVIFKINVRIVKVKLFTKVIKLLVPKFADHDIQSFPPNPVYFPDSFS